MNPTLPAQKGYLKKDVKRRLTFTTYNGLKLDAEFLPNSMGVFNVIVQLDPLEHQRLMKYADMELQLKFFCPTDSRKTTKWPACIQLAFNNTPLFINREDNKPLYLKELAHPGSNSLQITTAACIAPSQFRLQKVWRPTLRTIAGFCSRVLTTERCVNKIKRSFTSMAQNGGEQDEVEQTEIVVSLKCPISKKKILVPARGKYCKHLQIFDLESFLLVNSEQGTWRCPFCLKKAFHLEVDEYFGYILNILSETDINKVIIDPSAQWKAFGVKAIKEGLDSGAPMIGPIADEPIRLSYFRTYSGFLVQFGPQLPSGGHLRVPTLNLAPINKEVQVQEGLNEGYVNTRNMDTGVDQESDGDNEGYAAFKPSKRGRGHGF